MAVTYSSYLATWKTSLEAAIPCLLEPLVCVVHSYVVMTECQHAYLLLSGVTIIRDIFDDSSLILSAEITYDGSTRQITFVYEEMWANPQHSPVKYTKTIDKKASMLTRDYFVELFRLAITRDFFSIGRRYVHLIFADGLWVHYCEQSKRIAQRTA